MLKKPLVDGAIWQFEGQATVFYPPQGPCYRCLFPEPPPPGAVPSCAEAGVLGVLPGLVGCVQALEATKLILGQGTPLIGRMMHFDTLSGEVRTLRLRRDPKCAVCGERPTVTKLIDYGWSAGSGARAATAPGRTVATSRSHRAPRPRDDSPWPARGALLVELAAKTCGVRASHVRRRAAVAPAERCSLHPCMAAAFRQRCRSHPRWMAGFPGIGFALMTSGAPAPHASVVS